jgi:hypothetical protein
LTITLTLINVKYIYLKYSDGPIQIEISPPDTTYTVNETDSVNQINCTADCNPICTSNNIDISYLQLTITLTLNNVKELISLTAVQLYTPA